MRTTIFSIYLFYFLNFIPYAHGHISNNVQFKVKTNQLHLVTNEAHPSISVPDLSSRFISWVPLPNTTKLR